MGKFILACVMVLVSIVCMIQVGVIDHPNDVSLLAENTVDQVVEVIDYQVPQPTTLTVEQDKVTTTQTHPADGCHDHGMVIVCYSRWNESVINILPVKAWLAYQGLANQVTTIYLTSYASTDPNELGETDCNHENSNVNNPSNPYISLYRNGYGSPNNTLVHELHHAYECTKTHERVKWVGNKATLEPWNHNNAYQMGIIAAVLFDDIHQCGDSYNCYLMENGEGYVTLLNGETYYNKPFSEAKYYALRTMFYTYGRLFG